VLSVSERTLVRLAWCAWAAAIALVAAEVGMLLAVNYGFSGARTYDYGMVTIFAPVYATLGLVVATRRPRHPIGWLLMGCGLTIAMQVVAGQYAALAGAAALPGRLHGLWASTQVQSVGVGLLVLLLLLFPTGRPLSPRWRPAVWSLVAGVSLTFVTQGLKPRTLSDFPGEQNPFGVPALESVLGPLDVVGGVLLIGGIIGAVASLVGRLRRARGRERQQIKWFVYVALVGIVAIIVLEPLLALLSDQLPGAYGSLVGTVLSPWLLAPIALAVTVAAAIVRHRLYDIDRVINRTLVYGVLTVLLGAVYAASVFLLGRLLDPAGGQSELAVAASTLAVAALFQPARRRVQSAVDRRFNRRKYDAARTVAAFSARLRDQVDLDTLSAELLTVVNQTMQPTTVSLWLRQSAKTP
jgi:hypothetical protein